MRGGVYLLDAVLASDVSGFFVTFGFDVGVGLSKGAGGFEALLLW